MNRPRDRPPLRIRLDDLNDARIAAFLDEHLADMRRVSPPESVHALDLSGLRRPEIRFWSAWIDIESREVLAGTVALKRLDAEHAELKSMRTLASLRGQGIGARLLQHVFGEARRQGHTRISLETGSQPFFTPARTLYARHGFEACTPFGDYEEDPASVFMTLQLRNTDDAPGDPGPSSRRGTAMLIANKLMPRGRGLAPVLRKRAATVELDWDVRQKSRFDTVDSQGRRIGIFLPRGTAVRGGDVLVAEDGSLVRVVAAPQQVLRITHCAAHGTPFDLTRAAYHLGNRHVPIELQPDHLKIEPDHVLADMLRAMHLIVQEVEEAFEPEGGAYGGHVTNDGHSHHHRSDEGPGHDHDHAHDHPHDHGHDPSHSHRHTP